MKILIYLIPLILIFTKGIFAQNAIDGYLKINPNEIETINSEIQEYDVTLKWQNLNAISGNKINCNAVRGTYIISPDNNLVQWKNVSLAQIGEFNQTHFDGSKLPAFNNFTYKQYDINFLKEDFYKNIPAEQKDLAKWLVSDAIQMQGLANLVFDSLRFKKVYYPSLLNNYDVEFENWVTFSSRYQKLLWSGITKHNNEICAVVKFESLYNPIEINNDEMQMKGRALYYGEMWISLSDKQVEYASMIEDDLFKLESSLFPDGQLIDLQREIVFDKVK